MSDVLALVFLIIFIGAPVYFLIIQLRIAKAVDAFNSADEEMKKGNYDIAIEHLLKAVKASENPLYYIYLSRCYDELDDKFNVLLNSEKAIALYKGGGSWDCDATRLRWMAHNYVSFDNSQFNSMLF